MSASFSAFLHLSSFGIAIGIGVAVGADTLVLVSRSQCRHSAFNWLFQCTTGLTHTKPINRFTSHLSITMECASSTQCRITKNQFSFYFIFFRVCVFEFSFYCSLSFYSSQSLNFATFWSDRILSCFIVWRICQLIA